MIDDLKKDAEQRMAKSLDALANAFNKIRTGRAHSSLLNGISIDYAITDIGDQSVALYSNVFSLKIDLGIFRR